MSTTSTSLSGLIAVNKPLNMTSHDVVSRMRKILGTKKVGHAGTLDPDATGVLLVAFNQATRLCNYLSSDYKRYQLTLEFSCETSSDDAASLDEPARYSAGDASFYELRKEHAQALKLDDVPVYQDYLVEIEGQLEGFAADSAQALLAKQQELLSDKTFAEGLLSSLAGQSYLQVPPAVSAIHVDGQRAYDLARRGEDFALEPRSVKLRSCSFMGASLEERAGKMYLRWHLDLEISKGGYIRSFARDLGRALAYPAYVVELERSQSGAINLADCVDLDDLAYAPCLEHYLLDPIKALGCASYELDESEFEATLRGAAFIGDPRHYHQASDQPQAGAAQMIALYHADKLYALAELIAKPKASYLLQPRMVADKGIAGCGYDQTEALDKLKGFAQKWKLYPVSSGVLLPKPLIEYEHLGEAVCCIGAFDGVHSGHRFLIEKTLEDARAKQLPSVIISFDRDPDEYFFEQGSKTQLKKLQGNRERLQELATFNPDYLLVIPFTQELVQTDYQGFLSRLTRDYFRIKTLPVGCDFRLGAGGGGGVAEITRWLEGSQAEVIGYPLLKKADTTVSSSTIRQLIEVGELEKAAELLGKDYALIGKVEHGRKVGRSFGIPTANIQEDFGSTLPAEAVYAGWVEFKDAKGRICYPAAISVGEAPSFPGEKRAHIEAFLLGFSGKLYHRKLRLGFSKKLRDMMRFESSEELIATVKHNIEEVHELFGDKPWRPNDEEGGDLK